MVMAPIPEFGVVLVGRNDGVVFHDTEVLRLQQLMMTIDALISAAGFAHSTSDVRQLTNRRPRCARGPTLMPTLIQ